MFIVLEGIDGSGKSTHSKLLGDFLRERGYNVLLTSEPTNGKIGMLIREILAGKEKVDPKTLALLFTADRYEHIEKEIEPALKENKIVISERYYHSTIAYQSAQGVEKEWLFQLNRFAIKPDLVIVLDLKPEVALKRVKSREIFEKEGFLRKVREHYLSFEDVSIVDGNKIIEEVQKDIREIVINNLKIRI
ncbi:MAG TPA: dTMP kinase [Candidatus Altiarchaeales archaeon]|nr:dTMP kinase [Candidatus Altiarchaeales archaeon]